VYPNTYAAKYHCNGYIATEEDQLFGEFFDDGMAVVVGNYHGFFTK
jgi:hypothetical protein